MGGGQTGRRKAQNRLLGSCRMMMGSSAGGMAGVGGVQLGRG